VAHLPAAVHQHAHPPPDLGADGAELSGELLGEQAFRRKPAAEQTLELANLAGLEALGVAEDLDGPESS
jgi:hypothetical protein